jgi:hypothetical protein
MADGAQNPIRPRRKCLKRNVITPETNVAEELDRPAEGCQ